MAEQDKSNCSKCGLPKQSEKKGTMTQWISVCQCELNIDIDEDSSYIQICKNCGKRIVTGPDGSLTQWIRKQDKCDCENPEPVLQSSQLIDQSELEDSSIKQTDYVEEEELSLDPESFPFDRFKPLSNIGKGTAGYVYLARDRLLRKKVAIKCLRNITSAQTVNFQREARALSQLEHPSIVKVMDFGVNTGGSPYMVMEYIKGESLETLIRENEKLSLRAVIDIFKMVAEGLSHAHVRGIFHRDLKASNLMILGDLNSSFQSKIIDFGIASIRESQPQSKKIQGTSLVGTPTYMSPDQLTGKNYDARSEIYSLGCVMFEAIAGKPPFRGATPLETMSMHAHHPIPTLEEKSGGAEFPESLDTLFEKCLAKEQDERFQSMEELLEFLETVTIADPDSDGLKANTSRAEYYKSERRIKTPVLVLVVIIGLLGVIAFGATFLQQKISKEENTKTLKAQKSRAKKLVREAREKLENSKYVESLDLAKNALELDPDNLDALDVRGLAYLSVENKEKALEDFTAIINRSEQLELNPARAYFHRAIVHASDRNIELARQDFKLSKEGKTPYQPTDYERMKYRYYLKYWRKRKPKVVVWRNMATVENGSDRHLTRLSKYSNITTLRLVDTEFNAETLGQFSRCPITDLNINACSFHKDGLSVLPLFKKLKKLNISNAKNFFGEELRYLSNLPNLEHLNVSNCPNFTGSGLKYVKNLKKLTNFSVFGCKKFNGDGLKYLSTAPITYFFVSDSPISDKGLEQLKNWQHLKFLYMFRTTGFEGSGLSHLKNSNIEFLYLSRCDIQDKNWQYLTGWKKLNQIAVSNCKSFKCTALEDCLNLESIKIDNCGVSDSDFKTLSKLPGLRALSLARCPLTGVGISELAKIPITSLVFNTIALKPEAFSEIAQVKTLSSIRFFDEIYDAGFGGFLDKMVLLQASNLDQLAESNQFSNWRFPEKGMEELGELPRLIHLSIDTDTFDGDIDFDKVSNLKSLSIKGKNPLSKESVEKLVKLPLQSLSVFNSCISGEGWELISRSKTLRKVVVRNLGNREFGLGERGIVALSNMKLDYLSIYGAKFSSKSLEALSTMKSLKELYCNNCLFLKDQDMDRLKKALPGCNIEKFDFRDRKKLLKSF